MIIRELLEQIKPGTYAGVRFSDATKQAVREYCVTNKIPNAVNPNKLHCTLLYSRKHLPNFKAAGIYKEALIGIPTGFENWKSQPTTNQPEPTNCLVLKFICPELEQRHIKLMTDHQATYDYPEYKTHMTFSYNVGDLDPRTLPKFNHPIEIVEEYGQDLVQNWADENGRTNKV